MTNDKKLSDQEIARQRDETIKRMFATPGKTHKGQPKKAAKKKPKKA